MIPPDLEIKYSALNLFYLLSESITTANILSPDDAAEKYIEIPGIDTWTDLSEAKWSDSDADTHSIEENSEGYGDWIQKSLEITGEVRENGSEELESNGKRLDCEGEEGIYSISEFFNEPGMEEYLESNRGSVRNSKACEEAKEVDEFYRSSRYLEIESAWSSEREVISNVFMMLFGAPSDMFAVSSGAFNQNIIKLKHLTDSSLANILSFFINLGTTLYQLRSKISDLKIHENRYFSVFGDSLGRILASAESNILDLYSTFTEIHPTQSKYSAGQSTLISLYCHLQDTNSKVIVLCEISMNSLLHSDNQAYNTSYLLSKVHMYTEHYKSEYPFLLEDCFLNLFSCYVLDINLWISSGITNACFMIGRIFDSREKWEQFGVVFNGNRRCVPDFLVNICRKVLAIGNYTIIFRELQDIRPKDYYPQISPYQLHEEIIATFNRIAVEHGDSAYIQLLIDKSLGSTIDHLYISLGESLFSAFSNEFQFLSCLSNLRGIYLLEDIDFMILIQEIFLSLHETKCVYGVSSRINNFFEEKHYKSYFSCEYSMNIRSLSEINIIFSPPPAFKFIVGDTLHIYNQLMHFILQLKFTSYVLKQCKPDYNIMHIRQESIHFIDCLEYYVFVSTIYSASKDVAKEYLSIKDVQSVRNAHSAYLNRIGRNLFMGEKQKALKFCISDLMEHMNNFFGVNAEEQSQGVIQEFSEIFGERIRSLLKVLREYSEGCMDSECNFYIDRVAYCCLCFNSYYK